MFRAVPKAYFAIVVLAEGRDELFNNEREHVSLDATSVKKILPQKESKDRKAKQRTKTMCVFKRKS